MRDAAARFDFVGKAGKRRRLAICDPKSVGALAPLERRRGTPEHLVVHRGSERWRRVHAADVNNALRRWGDGPFCAVPDAAAPPRIEAGEEEGIVIELPIEVDGDAVRVEVERRARELLVASG